MKLHEYLEESIKCLEEIEQEIEEGSQDIEIDMGTWHSKLELGYPCMVCLAGCYMRQRLGITDDRNVAASDEYFSYGETKMLNGIDYLRKGELSLAMFVFYKDPHMAGIPFVSVERYDKDKVKFKKEMREIVEILRKREDSL